jgi:hypothetical protein
MGSQEPKQKMTRIIRGFNNQIWVHHEGFRRTPLKVRVTETKYSTSTPIVFPITSTMPRSTLSLTRSSAMDPNDLKIPEESQRPWYMTGGQLYPKNIVINTTTGMRNIRIFPDELPGEDRIPGRAGLASFIKEDSRINPCSLHLLYFQINCCTCHPWGTKRTQMPH